ncbi:MAG: hypothetical protein ABIP55_10980 [Tepidisphaeraceae bacterium]
MDLQIPELQALPADRREDVLRDCRESDEYRSLGRRQAPRVMVIGALFTLGIVGLLAYRHEISLGVAVIVTWAIFLLCIPPIRMWNRAQQRRLLKRLVRERLSHTG